ncbi:helix-turn-helix domain-containing protein [Acuticoccus kandeliae]|uniref:helix-turn-helix domain-containing protein n=1 Tax=Acuticoccus kandeliae TaxID=2073160 RepID=UPI000D3E233A|nr:helix-turn-helix domain-containing protein [Acuticoccus kandeliae]
MDSLINAAARALAVGDTLGALNWIALREDAPALALRGIAMAQLGDFEKAKTLLAGAARAFGPREAVARARCVVAEAEIALVSRDLAWPVKALDGAEATLSRRGDRINAAFARYLAGRRLLLIGRLDEAEAKLAGLDASLFSPALAVGIELVAAGIAMRRVDAGAARAALARAEASSRAAGIAALAAEVEAVALALDAPAARLVEAGGSRLLLLDEVEAVFASSALIVDACRHGVRHAGAFVALERRPVLFALARTLALAFPGDAPRAALLFNAFRARHADESHRARLRVEIGRLRKEIGPFAAITATDRGFRLEPREGAGVIVLTPPVEDAHADILALLADGQAWSSSALALALGASQRTVQRALLALEADGKIQAIGRARARRWMTPPVPGFPTALLLPAPMPGG